MSEPKKKNVKPKASPREAKMLQIAKKMAKISKDEDSIHIGDKWVRPLEYISTGDSELDRILAPTHFEETGIGGIPRGFLCEFYGPTGGGKSSLCMNLAASATQAKDPVFWIDAEGSYNPEWAQTRGIDTRFLMVSEAGKSGEAFMDELLTAASSGDFALVVVDSLTALQPQIVMDADLTKDPKVAAKALMMSRTCPLVVPAAKRGNTAVIFINQIRININVKYGNPEDTPGGQALRYFSSLRLRLAQLSASKGRGIMKGDEEIGIRSNVQVVKSRFGPPYRETVIPFYYSQEKPEPLDMLLDIGMSSKLIRVRTRDNVQHFTLDGHKTLKSVPTIDEFRAELVALPDEIKELARRIQEEKGKALPADVLYYVEHVNDSPLDGLDSP